MKYLLVALVFVANFGCRKVDNAGLNAPCSSDCITVSGKFTTSGNKPLANIPVEIRSERSLSRYSYEVRRIAETTTDVNGNYYLRFALRDYETGSNSTASVFMKFDYDESKLVPIHKSYKDFWLARAGYGFPKKDTLLIKNFYLPNIASVNLRLTGFHPPLDWANNYFNVTAVSKAGEASKEIMVAGLLADSELTTKEMLVGGNDSTKFIIERRKNGITTIKDTVVYTPITNTTNLAFNF